MYELPVTMRDLQVLFTAELSVSRRFACAIAGKWTPDCCDIDFFSANMITWYDEENVIFFDYSINGMKYAAILMLRQWLPSLSGSEQFRRLRQMKKFPRFADYKDLWCMLIIPGKRSYPVEYPVMSWSELKNMLLECNERSADYMVQMFKSAADGFSCLTTDCLTLD